MRHLLARGQISAVELLDAHVDRIAATNPDVNAFTTTCFDRARAAAMRADRSMARGDRCGPLHGLPYVVKDNFDVAGMVTTCGTGLFSQPAPGHAPHVANICRAGAIIIAKTNLPEFAFGGQTTNRRFGTGHTTSRHTKPHSQAERAM